MLPELEEILDQIISSYNKGLEKRYPPDAGPEKQSDPAAAKEKGGEQEKENRSFHVGQVG